MTIGILTDADTDAIRAAIHPALVGVGLPSDEDILSEEVAGEAEREIAALDPDWLNTLSTANGDKLRAAARLMAAAILAPTALGLVPTTFNIGDLRVSVALPKPEALAAALSARAGAAVRSYQSDPAPTAVASFAFFGRAPGGRGRMFP